MPDTHTIKVVRLYADDFGECRFETVTMAMLQKEFAPPAAPLHVTDTQPAQHDVVS
jgi:hypothetical protein